MASIHLLYPSQSVDSLLSSASFIVSILASQSSANAKARAQKEKAVVQADADRESKEAQINADTLIAQKENDLAIKKAELQKDADTLELLILMIADITPEHDTKLQELYKLISQKIENPINPGNKKVLIFTAFSDVP